MIKSPVNGYVTTLDKVQDEVFASKMMGEGLTFISNDNKVYSPVDGEIVMTAGTKHAIGIITKGVEILIHVGLDTCNLNGEGLNIHVKAKDRVSSGDLLLDYNLDFMKENGMDMSIPMVITNTNECNIEILYSNGDVSVNTEVIKAIKNESN